MAIFNWEKDTIRIFPGYQRRLAVVDPDNNLVSYSID